MSVSIYKLANQPFNKAFAKLVEVIVAKGEKLLIYCSKIEFVKQCDQLLWSYEQLSFLPHQMKGDNYLEEQKVYITDGLADNPHNAEVVLFYDTDRILIPKDFRRILYMLSSEESNFVDIISSQCKQKDMPCSLLLQQANGSWHRNSN